MSDKFFLDTNILVYSFDNHAKAKRNVALDLVESALETHLGIISYQVVQEFLNVATRKFAKPLTSHDAQAYLQKVLGPLCEVYPSIELYHEALTLSKQMGYSFYDCLILASAVSSGCDKIYTEDMQHGQRIAGLSIINPFLIH